MYLNSNQISRTVNWHFTNKCNMSCQYCFVPCNKELSLKESFIVLSKLRDFFSRINFVGGEPTLSSKLKPLVIKARELGFEVSIVTNGYIFSKNPDYLYSLIHNFSIVGISVDSLNKETNLEIGRCSSMVPLSESDYISLCNKITSAGCKLKVNTVVSKLNLEEDFNQFYQEVNPSRIKLLQVLKPAGHLKRNYDCLQISEEEYKAFVRRHSGFSDIICSESNEQMLNSYYILNSIGCFLDNKTGKSSKSLLKYDLHEVLLDIFIDEKKYSARYA